MKKIFFISILMALTLSSCAKGAKIIEKKDRNDNVKFVTTKFEYDTPANIALTYKDVQKKTYEHLIFNEELNINECETVQKIKLKSADGFVFGEEEKLVNFLNGEALGSYKNAEIKNDTALGEYHQLNASGGHPYFTFYDNGRGVWIKSSYSEKHFLPTDDTFSQRIFLENGYEDKEFKLHDGNMSISEAIEICCEFTDELTDKYGYPKISPTELHIQKQGGNYSFLFRLSQKINNAPLRAANCGFSGRTSNSNDTFSGVLSQINSNPNGYSLLICSSDGVECFRSNEAVMNIEKSEDLEQIVTLDCALSFIDKNISKNTKYEVEYIGLENKIYYIEKDTKLISSQPMWTASLYNSDEEKWYYALIDCETGDFSFYGQ